MNTAWQAYVNFWQQNRFVNLTAEELKPACPHLSDLDFELATSYRTVTLALPPVRVKGSFRVAVFNRTEQGYLLQWLANSHKIRDFNFASSAVAYADQTWPEALIEDTWVDVQNIQLCDPTHLNLLGSASPITTLYVTLLQSWEEIEQNTHSPLYRSWNNAIQYITTNPIEGGEYGGGHRVHMRCCCSYCGGGFDTNRCSGCSFSYRSLKNGWKVPLAPQLVEFLESWGHHFTFHPSGLWQD